MTKDEKLWAIHVLFTDDIIACISKERADYLSKEFTNVIKQVDPTMAGTDVIEWPWSKESHIEELKKILKKRGFMNL